MTLPLIYPAAPGYIEGIVSADPPILQCQECGEMADRGSLGIGEWGTLWHVTILSHMRFHFGGWTDGTNARLCRDCRQARRCDCISCRDERPR